MANLIVIDEPAALWIDLTFNRDLNAVLGDKEMVARILTIGPSVEAGKPEHLEQFMKAEHERWARLAKEIGVLPE